MISFVISSFNKPTQLLTCISSLVVQVPKCEIIVCDNTLTSKRHLNKKYCQLFPEIKYIDTSSYCPPDINAGYAAQNIGARKATGEYLCFPSEDCYYVPGFSQVMLDTAKQTKSQFIFCDMLYDPRYNGLVSPGIYQVVPAWPRLRFIDKSNFIVKRELFTGFQMKEHGYGDFFFVQSLVDKQVPMSKAPGCLMVHN